MLPGPTTGSTRRTVRWSGDSSPVSGRKGFGRSGRLRGQRRVPPPPARITAYIRAILGAEPTARPRRGCRDVAGRRQVSLADDDVLALPHDRALPLVVAREAGRELGEHVEAVRPGIDSGERPRALRVVDHASRFEIRTLPAVASRVRRPYHSRHPASPSSRSSVARGPRP